MNIGTLTALDSFYKAINSKLRITDLTDQEFATSEEIKKLAFEVAEVLKNDGIKVTYNNLTNMNLHTLVKILNYNDFFRIPKALKNELKQLKLNNMAA